jgi:hypothetical protein
MLIIWRMCAYRSLSCEAASVTPTLLRRTAEKRLTALKIKYKKAQTAVDSEKVCHARASADILFVSFVLCVTVREIYQFRWLNIN